MVKERGFDMKDLEGWTESAFNTISLFYKPNFNESFIVTETYQRVIDTMTIECPMALAFCDKNVILMFVRGHLIRKGLVSLSVGG